VRWAHRGSEIDRLLPGWSPDATKIVFTLATNDGKRSDIAIVNADGSALLQITHTGDADEADWGTHPVMP
jgi:Tol biopolymer transport system component